MSYRIYVAAPWAYKDQAREVSSLLESVGIEPTSRWVHFPGDTEDKDLLLKEATNDFNDVRRADGLLLLNLQKRGEETSGKAVETGIALALGKPVFMVGENSNIFHHLPPVIHYHSVEGAIKGILIYASRPN